MIVQIAVIGAAALIGLGVVSMIISAIKSMAQGKQDFKRIAIMAVPFVAFGVSYLVLENIVEAAVMSAAFMMASMALAILLSGLRGTFKF
tara:strand:- start:18806 stop:19075 length:270 start_codon:yes stop_codon:yes gene_type:complete